MAKWTATVTNKGIALQSKQVKGSTLSFTKVLGGAGTVELVNLKEQTAVSNIKQTISVESIRTKAAEYTITVLLSNSGINTGYKLSQIGFYAIDPDEGEILFAIAQADTPESVPSATDAEGFCLEFAFTFKNSNEAAVNITVDLAGYVSSGEIQQLMVEQQDILTTSNIVSGKGITVTDSADAPINDIIIHGASEQVTTKGYQLFDYNAAEFATSSKGGATLTNNGDGTFTISGSGLLTDDISAYHYYTHAQTVKLFKAGTLRLASDISTTPRVYIHPQRNGGNIGSLNVTGNTKFEITQDMLDDETFRIIIGFYGATGNYIASGTIKPMLYQDGDGTFEIFTGGMPGPNPDYPQEIESVGDDGDVQVSTYCQNFVNPEKITIGSNDSLDISDDGYEITVTGSVGYANSKCWFPISFAGKTITVKYDSAEWTNMGSSNTVAQLVYKSGGVLKYLPLTLTTATKLTKTIPDDATDLYLALCTNNVNTGLTTPATVKIKGLMVCMHEEGSDMAWCPYQASVAKVPLAEPMRGIPVSSSGNYTDVNGQQWLCDEIDLDRRVYIKRTNIVDLSTLEWSYSADYLVFTALVEDIFPNTLKIACTHYKASSRHDAGSPDMTIYGRKVGELGGIGVKNSNYTDATTFKSAMTGAMLVYELATPIETPLTNEQLTALQNLQTYAPITNIFTDDIGELTVEYFKNTDNGKAASQIKKDVVDLTSFVKTPSIQIVGFINTSWVGVDTPVKGTTYNASFTPIKNADEYFVIPKGMRNCICYGVLYDKAGIISFHVAPTEESDPKNLAIVEFYVIGYRNIE